MHHIFHVRVEMYRENNRDLGIICNSFYSKANVFDTIAMIFAAVHGYQYKVLYVQEVVLFYAFRYGAFYFLQAKEQCVNYCIAGNQDFFSRYALIYKMLT